jgi:ADP-ribosylglycohydrolase
MCDGIAIASVTAAMVSAILLKEKPLLGALQHIYRYGGDTDTVGAMVLKLKSV